MLAETSKTKLASETLLEIQRVYSRLRSLGFAVERIHTAGGTNFTARSLNQRLGQLPEVWLSPRLRKLVTQRPIGELSKECARPKKACGFCFSKSKLNCQFWLAAARHSAERLLQHNLATLGIPTGLATVWAQGQRKKALLGRTCLSRGPCRRGCWGRTPIQLWGVFWFWMKKDDGLQ